MKRKNLLLALALASTLVSTGCDNNDVYEIGVLQYVNDPALNSNYQGFVDQLTAKLGEGAFNINLKIAAADSANNTSGAESLMTKSDLVFGIATPSAKELQTAAYLQQKDTPILFSAVTDPVASGLVSSKETPDGNITGTTDMNPVADQIALVKTLKPNAKKVGIIYTTSEDNSVIQKNLAKAKCDELGLTLVDKPFSTVSEIETAITSLKTNNIDALYIPTDNNCASNITTIMSLLEKTNILVVAGEANLLTGGAHVSLGVDYYELGKTTANMAVDILKNGKKPSEIPVTGADEFPLYVNQASCAAFNITLSADFLKNAVIKNTGE